MKKLIIISLTLLKLAFQGQAQIIWYEDFDNEANNAQTGIAPNNWTVTTTPTGGVGSFSKQTHAVYGVEIFQVNQTGAGASGEGVWNSGPINISTSGEVTIGLNMYTGGASASDYIRCYYSVDGGPEVMFGELYGGGVNILEPASAVVTGNTLRIIVRGRENTAGNFTYDGFTGVTAMGFENVSVIRITTLYSRQNGTWDNTATWSTISHTGPSCGCTPNNTTHTVIGGADVVDIDAAADAINVTVVSGSTLRWTVNNIALNIHRGGDIRAQGTINRNGFNGSNISFAYPTIDTIEVNGTFSVGHIYLNSPSTQLLVSGIGAMNLSGNIRQITGSRITNNKTVSALAVTGQLQFIGTGATFTNNGLFTLTGDMMALAATNDNNIFTNANGATANIGYIDNNSATFFINNAGTINQSGNFLDVDPTSSFVNQGTGVWNWSSTASPDPDMYSVLNTTAAGNAFNFSGAGTQTVFASPTNGVFKTYHHLGIRTSGGKTAGGELDINGDLTIDGTASLTSNNNSINIGGNWIAASTNGNPFVEGTSLVTFDGTVPQAISTQNATTTETFGNLTINNTSTLSPQIILNSPVTVALTMTMTRGAINLNSLVFQIGTASTSAAVRGTLVHSRNESSGWFYGGILRRNFTNTVIADSTSLLGYFPMGTNTYFRPFYLSATVAPTAGLSFDMQHNAAIGTTNVSIGDPNPTIIQLRHNAYWQITPSNALAGGTYSIVMGGTGFGTVQNRNDLRAMKQTAVVGSNLVLTGSITNIRVQRNAISLAQLSATGVGNTGNQWYIASIDATNSTLPIKLGAFQARLIDRKVLITWNTIQEINNHHFTIQKTQDFRNYTDAGTIPGKLNSKTETNYSFTDKNPLAGKSYYRLKQTDIDGNSTYSELVGVNYDATAEASLGIYPNPANGSQVTLHISGLQKAKTVPVFVFSLQGLLVQKTMISTTSSGNTDLQIRFQTPLRPGVYTVKTGENLELSAIMLVK